MAMMRLQRCRAISASAQFWWALQPRPREERSRLSFRSNVTTVQTKASKAVILSIKHTTHRDRLPRWRPVLMIQRSRCESC